MPKTSLARKVTLPLLTFYGLGTILGAGIYVLIGEVTLRAGVYSPLAFILSASIAAITAYSFARLSSMHPKSAGEAAYVLAAFNSKSISALVGLAVVVIGTVSASTMVKGFAGYFFSLVEVPEIVLIISIIILITAFSIWGIGQSLMIAAVITIIEVCGLLFVIYAAIDINNLPAFDLPAAETIIDSTPIIFFAAFICFYAYIGFEDIVNIAEETINPTKIVPLAILLSLILSTLIYVSLSIACTMFVPANIFETSAAPLASIVEFKGYDPTLMAMISVIAIINGALVQQIMAARVMYGMAKQKMFFSIFQSVNAKTQTPVVATITVAGFILLLAASLDLVTLAEITSAITLIIFIIVQLSLLKISIQGGATNKLDVILPIIGILLNLTLVYFGFVQRI